MVENTLNPDNIPGWNCFCTGAENFGRIGLLGRAGLGEFGARLSAAFQPHEHIKKQAHELCHILYQKLGIKHAIQMRIEDDWVGFSSSSILYKEIIDRTFNTFPDMKSIYILCDERNTIQTENVRNFCKEKYGIDVFYKSDFLNIKDKNNLFLSLLDFEIASNAPFFIGNCESTFSSFVTFEKFCRSYEKVTTDYIYNKPLPYITKRYDNGGNTSVTVAGDKIYFRNPLLKPSGIRKDVIWKAHLLTHIGQIGDFSTYSQTNDGGPTENLVCGIVDEQKRSIEGFSISIDSPDISIEYRAKLVDGTITNWKKDGEFIGTRGQGLPIKGFAIRLKGPASFNNSCIYAGAFYENGEIIECQEGEWCETGNGNILGSMQISFIGIR